VIGGGLHYDVVVIGAGVAGLTAATRLAESGARVCVLAKGVGSTHLAPGTVDVLGYDPERVEDPAVALPEFVAKRQARYRGRRLRDLCGEMHAFFREHDVSGMQKAQFKMKHIPPMAMSPPT